MVLRIKSYCILHENERLIFRTATCAYSTEACCFDKSHITYTHTNRKLLLCRTKIKKGIFLHHTYEDDAD